MAPTRRFCSPRDGVRAEGPPRASHDRVVITGLAALTPAGTDVDALWEAYRTERDCTVAQDGVRLARVPLSAGDFLSPKERKRVDRLGLFAVIGSRLSLQDAGLELTDENRTRVGAIIGTGIGPMESMETFSRPIIGEGPTGANPAVFPNTVYNAAGGQVAIKIGVLGSASTVTAGHASRGLGAVLRHRPGRHRPRRRRDLHRCRHAHRHASSPPTAGWVSLPAAHRQDDGDGIVLAEAGVALLVERLSHATCPRRDRPTREVRRIRALPRTPSASGGSTLRARESSGRCAWHWSTLGWSPVKSSPCGQAAADSRSLTAPRTRRSRRLFGADAPPVLAPKLRLGEPIGAGAPLGRRAGARGLAQA